MKKFTLIFLFIVFKLITFAQEMPKKANVIVIEKKTESLDYLTRFAKLLQSEAYPVNEINKDLLSVQTDFKRMDWDGIASLSVYAYAEQFDSTSIIRITGRVEVTSMGSTGLLDACNCGGLNNARIAAWKRINELVRKFEYDLIKYEVK